MMSRGVELTSYGDPGVSQFMRRSFVKGMGLTDADLQRPMIGVCRSGSELNHRNHHLRVLAEAIKRGVWAAGGDAVGRITNGAKSRARHLVWITTPHLDPPVRVVVSRQPVPVDSDPGTIVEPGLRALRPNPRAGGPRPRRLGQWTSGWLWSERHGALDGSGAVNRAQGIG